MEICFNWPAVNLVSIIASIILLCNYLTCTLVSLCRLDELVKICWKCYKNTHIAGLEHSITYISVCVICLDHGFDFTFFLQILIMKPVCKQRKELACLLYKKPRQTNTLMLKVKLRFIRQWWDQFRCEELKHELTEIELIGYWEQKNQKNTNNCLQVIWETRRNRVEKKTSSSHTRHSLDVDVAWVWLKEESIHPHPTHPNNRGKIIRYISRPIRFTNEASPTQTT